MRKKLALAVLAGLLALPVALRAQTTAKPEPHQLPVLTLHTSGVKGADKAIAVTSAGDTVYQGSRGGAYYYHGDSKRYLNARQREALGIAKQ